MDISNLIFKINAKLKIIETKVDLLSELLLKLTEDGEEEVVLKDLDGNIITSERDNTMSLDLDEIENDGGLG